MSPAATAETAETAETAKTIDAATLKSMLEENPNLTVIDVRNPAEFESVHIAGSHNIPLPLLSAHTVELAARLDDGVVLMCQSGVRAKQAHERLAAAGL